jgi:hypothetical protein
MVKRATPNVKTNDLIESIAALKASFSPSDSKRKIAIIEKLIVRSIKNPRSLIKYHDTLCFLQAYPDNPPLLKLVDIELADFAGRVEYFREVKGPDDDRIDDTGMVDTIIHYPYNIHMASWLVDNYGPSVDIDWDDYAEKEDDPISGMLNMFALYMESDGVDDEDLTTEDWIAKATGSSHTALSWLLEKLNRIQAPFEIKQYLYDNSELQLKWHLGRTGAARTLAKNPCRKIYFQKKPMKKQKIDLRKSLRKAAPALSLLSAKTGSEIINRLIRAQLPRHRELYPVLYANPAEVYSTSPGRGLEIFILGMRADDRMPLETNYSALLIKNGVPIGYGIAVLLFERCEIAINVFDTFRSGEASLIFEHFFRVFYHHFGGRAFIMRRWQVGHENEEGLQSGSFWFYFKLGFRSIDPRANELARAEWLKIRKDKSYRTDIKTLKKLALSDMVIDLRPNVDKPYEELLVSRIAFALTYRIAEKYNGDGRKAESDSMRSIKRALGIDNLESWTVSEKLQFRRWSPILASIPDFPTWKTTERKHLLRIIRSKAAIREKNYVEFLQEHRRLRNALMDLAAGGDI